MIITPSATFTRPADATAYAPNELVANSTTAGSVTPMEFSVGPVGGRGIIRRLRLFKDDETTTAATFVVHLFTASPVVTNGDNGAFAVSTTANYLASVAVDMSSGALASTTDLWKASSALEIGFQIPNAIGSLYGLIEVTGAYAPSSGEAFTVTLEIEG